MFYFTRYDEIISTHNATADQLQICQEENARLKSQTHELTQERNSAVIIKVSAVYIFFRINMMIFIFFRFANGTV